MKVNVKQAGTYCLITWLLLAGLAWTLITSIEIITPEDETPQQIADGLIQVCHEEDM